MLKSLFRKQETLDIFIHRYQPYANRNGFEWLESGKHKVVVDDTGKYVIGYAEKVAGVYYLVPFIETACSRLSDDERVKLIINGKSAKVYEGLHPNDPLHNLFFKPARPEHLRDVEAVPIAFVH